MGVKRIDCAIAEVDTSGCPQVPGRKTPCGPGKNTMFHMKGPSLTSSSSSASLDASSTSLGFSSSAVFWASSLSDIVKSRKRVAKYAASIDSRCARAARGDVMVKTEVCLAGVTRNYLLLDYQADRSSITAE